MNTTNKPAKNIIHYKLYMFLSLILNVHEILSRKAATKHYCSPPLANNVINTIVKILSLYNKIVWRLTEYL